MSKQEKALDLLFVSKVRIKALAYFLLNPDRSIHLRGAVREFKEEINAVRRELLRLEEMKLISVEKQGNRKYFKLNIKHIFIDELMSIFHKSYGIGGEIIQKANKIGDLDFAILTSSYTKGIYIGDQIIDLALIGDVNLTELESIVKAYEHKSGREIHYTVLKTSEFQTRKRRRDDFIMNLVLNKSVMLVGQFEDLVR
ncbi:MAG: hypothetical protein Kow0081_1280 [Candidatus Dojkabacteria bacterium]